MRAAYGGFEVGGRALTRDGNLVEIVGFYREDGVTFAAIKYLDGGDARFNVGGRVSGTEDAPIWEHRVRSGKVIRSGGDYYNDADWVVEKGLRKARRSGDTA